MDGFSSRAFSSVPLCGVKGSLLPVPTVPGLLLGCECSRRVRRTRCHQGLAQGKVTPSTGLTGTSTLLHPAPALGLSHLLRTPGVASPLHAQPRPDFWGVLWSKSHHCGLMRCDPVGAYHTAARANPESPSQCLTVTFQGISDSGSSSSAAKPHWGAMMGPVSWM